MKKLFVILGFILGLQIGFAQTNTTFARLQSSIETIANSVNVRWGIYIKNVDTGEEISLNAEIPMETMSVIKIPIMVEAFRQVKEGKIKLTDRVELNDDRRRWGTGILQILDSGMHPTLKDYITLMIIVSDNSATDVVLETVGGPERVTASMKLLGFQTIRCTGTTFDWFRALGAAVDPSFAKAGPAELFKKEWPEGQQVEEAVWKFHQEEKNPFGLGSPREIGALMEMIVKGKAVSEDASKQMMGILGNQIYSSRIPRYLPNWWAVPHKTGDFPPYLANDVGVIQAGKNRIVFIAFNSHFRGFYPDLENAIARMALEVYNYYNYR